MKKLLFKQSENHGILKTSHCRSKNIFRYFLHFVIYWFCRIDH